MTDLYNALTASSFGMKAQSTRIRVITENMANASTAATTPNSDPYTRQVTTFKNVLNRELDTRTVEVDRIEEKRTKPFPTKFMPDHPGADKNGYVKMPNVEPLIETMDMQEAQRSYEANLGMIDQSRNMILQTIDILRR